MGAENGSASGGAARQRGFPHQPRQGGQRIERIGQEDQGLDPRQSVDRHALQAPIFQSGVAAFHGVARPPVERLPGRAADRDIPHQADGCIGKVLAHIHHPAMLVRLVLVGTLWRGIDHLHQTHLRLLSLQASLVAAPFVALALLVKTVRHQAVAIVADRPPTVVVAPRGPQRLVPIRDVLAQIDHTPGGQGVNGMQEAVETEPGIAGHGIHVQIGIAVFQLQKQGRTGQVFVLVGRAHIIQQGHTETPERIGQAQRQAAVAVVAFAVFCLAVFVLRGTVGVIGGLVRAGVPHVASFRIAWSGVAADLAQARLSHSHPRRSLSLAGQVRG